MDIKEQEILRKEAMKYFKQTAYKRLFAQLYEKCFSLGRLGGTVRLSHLTKEEANAFEGLLQKDCHNKTSISFSVEKLRKALFKTKFAQVTLEELVTQYFQGEIPSKKEIELQEERLMSSWFIQMEKQYEHTRAGEWLNRTRMQNKAPYGNLVSDYRKNQAWLKQNLSTIMSAINNLPILQKEYQRLPVFAAHLCGNPHYFDVGERTFLYLLYGICGVLELDYPKKMNAELRNNLLFQAGLLIDDLSNWVLTYGIFGIDRNGNSHKGMEHYTRRSEPLTLTLSNLLQLSKAYVPGNLVYVVENPTVFSWLLDQQKHREEKVAVICSAGQLNQAVWVLLDLLIKSGARIYYAGDFDPEGLLIAQKIMDRYGENARLWHYSIEDCIASKSKEKISESSLKKLNGIEQKELKVISEFLQKTQLAGYQENILERLIL